MSETEKITPSPAADSEPVLLRSRDNKGVATLTLNRPRQYNALSRSMMSALETAMDEIRDDEGVRAVVLEGAGRGFCAGHDLKELRSGDRGFLEQTFTQCSRLMKSITRLPQPVIAKVHGIATAAGCQLVATCDLAVSADSARFGTPGVNIGLFCSTPMVAISRNLPRKRAMEMLLLGETLDAETAASYGLVNFVVPEDALEEETARLTNLITNKSGLTLAIGKEAFYRQIDFSLDEAYSYASEVMTRNMLARDAEEGIDAFLEKRDPVWENR
jgi:enoyl-CoA hydratase/carnithine racemase